METLEATVHSTVFRNPENGYSVLTVKVGRQAFTVVGTLPEMANGEQALFTGEWIEHRTYGRQFRCDRFEIREPTTLLGIERYLGSGMFRGIKEHTAAQIVAYFGEETLTVLSEHPERLTEIPGIGRKRCIMIAESFQERQKSRRTMIFLQSYGISPALATKIVETYGDDAPNIIQNNPYRLCTDLERVGFKTADRIGIALGFPADGKERIRSAMIYVLQDAAAANGHVYLPEDELCSRTAALLEAPKELCRQHLTGMLLDRRLEAESEEEGRRIYLPVYNRAEKDVALRLTHLMFSVLPKKHGHAGRDISSFEKEHGIRFSPTQRQAIRKALENGVFVITGGPGTGKTTIIQCVLELLTENHNIVLCAPTGRAAKRMTEATGVEAKTIHRLLEYNPESQSFMKNEKDPLEANCIIADEASMIDLLLMRSLLRAINPGSRLILVGDADQLPSVGAGNVLGDILESGQVPHIRLTDIFRQSETSRIVLNAHRINEGEMPLLNEKGTDFFFVRRSSQPEAAAAIAGLAVTRLPAYLNFAKSQAPQLSMRNIQVLSPTRKGECGVNVLNLRLQEALNPPKPGIPEFSHSGNIFRLGDKVIQIHNDYDLAWVRETDDGPEKGKGVLNGDIGFITEVNPGASSLTVRFDDERDVKYEADDLENLELAYCLSVHKAQGSEFPTVILSVAGGPPMLMTRNLLYTALTRAQKLVVLVGQEEIIQRMVENNYVLRRYTALSQRLTEAQELRP